MPALHPDTGAEIIDRSESPLETHDDERSIKELCQASTSIHLSDQEMRDNAEKSGHIDLKKLQGLSRGLLIAALFEVFVEPHLIQPHHITDHPIETTPLCKAAPRPKRAAQRALSNALKASFLRQEMCNAYTELNDPEHATAAARAASEAARCRR